MFHLWKTALLKVIAAVKTISKAIFISRRLCNGMRNDFSFSLTFILY